MPVLGEGCWREAGGDGHEEGLAGGEVMVPSSASQRPHCFLARAGAELRVQLCAGEPGGLGKLKDCSDPHVWGTPCSS